MKTCIQVKQLISSLIIKKVNRYFIVKKNKWYPWQPLFVDLKHAVILYFLNTLNTILCSQIEHKFDPNAK